MIALIQRVRHARVESGGATLGEIGCGLLVLLGVERHDNEDAADKLLNKVLAYRVFADAAGKMNLNVRQAGGALLVVSQFTLTADTSSGLRPGFSRGAPPHQAERLYEHFHRAAAAQLPTATGRFGADMQVSLQNDGPVTFWLQV